MAKPGTAWRHWLVAGVTLLLFVIAAWVVDVQATPTGGARIALWVALPLLGLLAAGLLWWYLRPAPAPSRGGTGDGAAVIESARKRAGGRVFDQGPVVLVVGGAGSCKTTLVTRGGLEVTLLAGDATAAGDGTTPTANVWQASAGVVVEAGTPLLADAAAYGGLVRALRAGLARGGSPPPRALVVTVSCDLFYDGGAGAQLTQLASLLRTRLDETARTLGSALPVYVVFTKADRIPHYEAWASVLTREEHQTPFGFALPFGLGGGGGPYADRVTAEVTPRFEALAASVAGRRLDLLARESVEVRRAAAYEFARELRKLVGPATGFLVDATRPAPTGPAAQLRGVYFVGARPVIVRDVAGGAGAAPARAAAGAPDATAVFSAAQLAAAAAAPSTAGATRKVPEWMFLGRLFSDVIFGDRGAAVAASGGRRASTTRRALLGAGIAATLLLGAGVATSWVSNARLTGRVEDAARAVAALPRVTAPAGTIAFASPEALDRLEALRAVLDTLTQRVDSGPAWYQRLGLWQGAALREAAVPVWVQGFRQQLYDDTWATLVDSLRALPAAPSPGDDYGTAYNRLKAYLVTTDEAPRSTGDFLAPVLLATWQRGVDTDADVTQRARAQFAFFGDVLARGHPFPTSADARLVTRARRYLGQFTGVEPIYATMLAAASKEAPPLRFAQAVPQSAGVVSDPIEVAGPYTAAGWTFMADALANADRYFEGERWVVGDETADVAADRDRLVADLGARYRRDFVDAWRAFVRGAEVVAPGAPLDAAQKLGIVGSAQSPLLALFALTARATDGDSAIAAAFQPVHAVTPPQVADKYVSEANTPYVNALVALQTALEQVGNMPPVVDTASAEALAAQAQQALQAAAAAKTSARQLAQQFAVDTAAARLGPTVASLLEAPITGAEAVLRRVASTRPPRARIAAGGGGGGGAAPPPAAPAGGGGAAPEILNVRGVAFCSQLNTVLSKFPFNADARDEATLDEVAAVFAPGSGALWTFQQGALAPYLEEQGGKWVVRGDAPAPLAEPFVAFFNRAAAVTDALFGRGAEPRFAVDARAVVPQEGRLVRVEIRHGQPPQVAEFDREANNAARVIEWPPQGQGAELLAQLEGGRFRRDPIRTVARGEGVWGLFRVFYRGRYAGDGGQATVTFTRDEVPVPVELRYRRPHPLLKRGWLGAVGCVPQVTP